MYRNLTKLLLAGVVAVALLALGFASILTPASAAKPVKPSHQRIFEPKIVFVTAASFSADLEGLAGADDKCQAAADDVPLVGEFMAWLSDDSATPTTRFTTLALGGYFTVNGRLVDLSFAALLDGNLAGRLDVNEFGDEVAGVQAWTGTLRHGSSGGNAFNRLCSNWTSDEDGFGVVGLIGAAVQFDWTELGVVACDSFTRRLYCFEQ